MSAFRIVCLSFLFGCLSRAEDVVPWGLATSSSGMKDAASWMPKMRTTGAGWVRGFPEWNSVEPREGEWHWDKADAFIESAEHNGLRLSACLMGSVPWSGDKPHTFPVANLAAWSDFVSQSVKRYHDRIKYWEVWNEGNGGFNSGHHTAVDYAALAAAVNAAAKKIDPTAQTGLSVASFDPAYLRRTIESMPKKGGSAPFDFLCIHPYELADGVGGDVPYLWMSQMLRDTLKDCAPEKIGANVWITEVGRNVAHKKDQPEAERDAAMSMVKLYVMALAQGIRVVDWFEAQDPAGEEPGFGLAKRDGSERQGFAAFRTMTSTLGSSPKYRGWVDKIEQAPVMGFLFQNGEAKVLVAWKIAGEADRPWPAGNKAIDIRGEKATIISDSPNFILNPSESVITQAEHSKELPFPWGGDFSKATAVNGTPGAAKPMGGVVQTGERMMPKVSYPDGSSGILLGANERVQFYVHPSFASVNTTEYYVRIKVRRVVPGNVGMNLVYEVADSKGATPYRNQGTWFSMPKEDGWHPFTWHVKDACFAKMWGYDISFVPEQSQPFVLGEVEVSVDPF